MSGFVEFACIIGVDTLLLPLISLAAYKKKKKKQEINILVLFEILKRIFDELFFFHIID